MLLVVYLLYTNLHSLKTIHVKAMMPYQHYQWLVGTVGHGRIQLAIALDYPALLTQEGVGDL